MLVTKAESTGKQQKIVKPQAFNWNHFYSKSYFEEVPSQNQLVFQSVYKCFETNGNRHKARAWKSKRLLDESIKYCSNVKSSRLRAKLDRNV